MSRVFTMIKDIKCIITSGCSFSAWDNQDTWPYHLGNILPHADIKYLGLCSSGNEIIQKKATLALHEALQTYKPEEILVLPMWSGLDRKAFYVSNEHEVDRMVTQWKAEGMWYNTQFADLKNKLELPKETFINETERFVYNHTGGWYIFHADATDGTPLASSYSRSNLDFTYGIHIGLENIIFLQEFCKNKRVHFYHQFYMDSVLDSIQEEQEHQIIKYLYEQLDQSIIVCRSQHGFLTRSGEAELFEDDQHPNNKGHMYYTERALWPFLKKKLDMV